MVRRISRDLFLADLDSHAQRLAAHVPADFDESAYASSLWQREASSA
ncbi:hypothetical protein [Paraburkholderia atlantica]|nr:hypothetical protein [Paraburkholderia atlantica]MBB5510252.1 hypothetical protein [Paraburkholderia atlantica]